MRLHRRTFLLATLAAPVLARAAAAGARSVEVYKSPTCGCCEGWVAHMRAAGFDVLANDVDQDALWALKARLGITEALASCHTALVDGYFVEGHVPADDVAGFLDAPSGALGIAVPGMPIGAPGMEMDDMREPYQTLALYPDGRVEVFAEHA